MKRLAIGITLLAITLTAPACSGDEEGTSNGVSITAPSGCEIKLSGDVYIAGLYPYSRWAVGDHWEKASLMAAEEINRHGGIDGQTLGLLICDTQGEKSVGVPLAIQIGSMEHVAAIIGAGRSAVTMGSGIEDTGVCRAGASEGIVSISPGSTNPAIGALRSDPPIQ